MQFESNHQCRSEAVESMPYCQLHLDIKYLLEKRYRYFLGNGIVPLTDYASNQLLVLFPNDENELTHNIVTNTKVWLNKITLDPPADGICRGLDLQTLQRCRQNVLKDERQYHCSEHTTIKFFTNRFYHLGEISLQGCYTFHSLDENVKRMNVQHRFYLEFFLRLEHACIMQYFNDEGHDDRIRMCLP